MNTISTSGPPLLMKVRHTTDVEKLHLSPTTLTKTSAYKKY